MTAGIYLITNKINGHMYVGGSINIENRLKAHERGDDEDNQIIDRAILKYGKDNFTYQIITELPADWGVIGEHEKYWINFYNTFKDKNHYNLTEGGEGICGWTHSEETRKKISKNMPDRSGKNHPFYNQKHTPETLKKMRESRKCENNPAWKDYPRITKFGKERNGKQRYKVKYNGKIFASSIYKERLYEKWYSKYPDIELIDETE